MRIYITSSPKNPMHSGAVSLLRSAGHDVYDPRQPAELVKGFDWADIDRNHWREWSVERQRNELCGNPQVQRALNRERTQLLECDAVVVVMPAARGSHLALGFGIAAGKPTYVVTMGQPCEPELLYGLCTRLVRDLGELIEELQP